MVYKTYKKRLHQHIRPFSPRSLEINTGSNLLAGNLVMGEPHIYQQEYPNSNVKMLQFPIHIKGERFVGRLNQSMISYKLVGQFKHPPAITLPLIHTGSHVHGSIPSKFLME